MSPLTSPDRFNNTDNQTMTTIKAICDPVTHRWVTVLNEEGVRLSCDLKPRDAFYIWGLDGMLTSAQVEFLTQSALTRANGTAHLTLDRTRSSRSPVLPDDGDDDDINNLVCDAKGEPLGY